MGRQSRLTFPYYSQYYNNKKSLDILYKTNIEDSERWEKGKKLRELKTQGTKWWEFPGLYFCLMCLRLGAEAASDPEISTDAGSKEQQ